MKVEVDQEENFGLPLNTVSKVPVYKKKTIYHTNKKNEVETWHRIKKFGSEKEDPDCQEEKEGSVKTLQAKAKL